VWLAEPQISFAQIAERLGFADTSSFYKAFRRMVRVESGALSEFDSQRRNVEQ
jgi:AraC-like DNA-binding protein